jgi:hypothetical protein
MCFTMTGSIWRFFLGEGFDDHLSFDTMETFIEAIEHAVGIGVDLRDKI